MKTKTLLIAAAALAMGIVTSMAQTYSQNVVGYVNLILTNGYNLVANQMDLDGTGTNNTIYTAIGTNLPPTTTKVYAWNTNSQTFNNITLLSSGAWTAGSAGPIVKQGLQPGFGVFVYVAAPTNITFVGQVMPSGTNYTYYPAQYQIASYPWPVAGYLITNLGYVVNAPIGTSRDQILQWNPASQTWVTHKLIGSTWSGGAPYIRVGEAFFLVPNQLTTWTNEFPTIQ